MSGENMRQIPDSFPRADNVPVGAVIPGDWGDNRWFELTIPNDTPIRVFDAIDGDPSGDPSASELPIKTLELIGWMVLNFSATCVWWGDDQVTRDFGVPIPAATVDGTGAGTCATPGISTFNIDPETVYIYQDSGLDVSLALCLMGKNIR